MTALRWFLAVLSAATVVGLVVSAVVDALRERRRR
jgi:hypothetical protein